MQFFLVIALSFGIFVGVDSITHAVVPDQPVLAKNKLAMNHDIFAGATRSYMANFPDNTGTYYWSSLKKYLAPSMAEVSIPSYWRAVIYSPGHYVICTEMTEEEGKSLQKRSLDDTKIRVVKFNNSIQVIASDSEAEVEAGKNKCNPAGSGGSGQTI